MKNIKYVLILIFVACLIAPCASAQFDMNFNFRALLIHNSQIGDGDAPAFPVFDNNFKLGFGMESEYTGKYKIDHNKLVGTGLGYGYRQYVNKTYENLPLGIYPSNIEEKTIYSHSILWPIFFEYRFVGRGELMDLHAGNSIITASVKTGLYFHRNFGNLNEVVLFDDEKKDWVRANNHLEQRKRSLSYFLRVAVIEISSRSQGTIEAFIQYSHDLTPFFEIVNKTEHPKFNTISLGMGYNIIYK